MHQFHNRVNRVDLEPAFAKIGTVGMVVMVILEQFPQHQKIKRRSILGFVFVVKIGVTVLVPAPIDDSAMNRPHQIMDGQ